MSYLRKNSFMIFLDEDAPRAAKAVDPQQIAEIEAAHQEWKKERIEALILERLAVTAPRDSRSPQDHIDSMLDRERVVSVLPSAPFDKETIEAMLAGEEALKEVEARRAAKAKAEEEARKEAEASRAAKTKAEEEALKERAAGPEGQTLRWIVQRVQGVGGDEAAFKDFVAGDHEMKDSRNERLRDFAWKVFEIDTSKADFSGDRYVPHRSSETTVRFRSGSDTQVGIEARSYSKTVDGKQVAMTQTETLHSQGPALWVKVADGAWAKDGNWGGYLQVTCATAKGKWIDSSDGWVTPVSSKADKVTFYDMGNYYEIWQKDRETGKPLTIQDGLLRFVHGATPGKFNLQDSTWD
ncbi:hypothetical protein [Streptomyces alboniger]|uniref:Uncharacterized protein n=1 Tax=Streptomyces alboniger TaxID=132473 RepID=A0A5J6HNV8_STRAD|nr:hypothetical protein [Streptomyces alboniger]QEV21989.1 hypothetical protein CP975_34820 [Streptomyces alboniger]